MARLLASWYDQLHAAGESLPDAALAGPYSEPDLVDADGLTLVPPGGRSWRCRWRGPRTGCRRGAGRWPMWGRTLTHNDFWYTNLAGSWDGSSALMARVGA